MNQSIIFVDIIPGPRTQSKIVIKDLRSYSSNTFRFSDPELLDINKYMVKNTFNNPITDTNIIINL